MKFKSRRFAVKIVWLYRRLCGGKKEYALSKQLPRRGTGIGANTAESECAVSRKDFAAKLYTALKECAESRHWPELLHETGCLTKERFEDLLHDCEEPRKINSG